jgi:tetratricopeptide (TPR) repeat protein
MSPALTQTTLRGVQDGETAVVLCANRAAALTKLGRFDDALGDADVAVKRRPHWAKAHFRRATALLGMRRYGDALTAFQDGLALEPQNESLLQGQQVAETALAQLAAAFAPQEHRCVRQSTPLLPGCLLN